ncbi:Uncharacterised protein [Chlamydia abortus]|uniref:glycan biosynthesis hexose transferase WsfD n=1 Tax=unclassified Paenibacillus TaxID=185978 RepID=UPI000A27AD2D|nr:MULTISPECIES: hypothetical protein [Paenibacillaceae]SHE11122.1 Uncharacterised protein [Chlamydia abortus]
MKLKLWKPEWLVVVFTALILAYLLMVKPLVGMANNGDFERIMNSAGLAYMPVEQADKYFSYFFSKYAFVDDALTAVGGYLSSQALLVKLTAWVQQWFQADWYDIRVLSGLYSLILMAALYRIVKEHRAISAWPRWVLAVLLVLVFADGAYAAYFNSLFGEPVSMLFLLLTFAFGAALTLRERPSIGLLAGFYVSAVFAISAKVQNAPIGIVLFLLSLRLWKWGEGRKWKYTAMVGSVLIILTSAIVFLSHGSSIKIINKYQTVFYGILKDSPNPHKDLEELGLNPEWAVLAGTNYFIPDLPINIKSPEFEQELDEKIGHSKIALFYLKHPVRYWEKLKITATQAFAIKPSYLGNYELSEHKAPGALSHTYTLWSKFKEHLLPNQLWFLIAFYGAFILVWVKSYLETKRPAARMYMELLMTIALIGVIQFIVPVIGDGEADLAKHLFLFNVCFDMLFVSGVVWVVHFMVRRHRRLQQLLSPNVR